jgi:hypothetical protein
MSLFFVSILLLSLSVHAAEPVVVKLQPSQNLCSTEELRLPVSTESVILNPQIVQVVIALVVTPEGLPLAYEVLAGNTADNTTLRHFLARIEGQYGRARRLWAMDRGIQTEAVHKEMREGDPPVHYLVGTPKGRLSRFEKAYQITQQHKCPRPQGQKLGPAPQLLVREIQVKGGEGEPGLGRHRAPPGRSCLLVTKVSRKLYANCTDIPRWVSGTFSYLLIGF